VNLAGESGPSNTVSVTIPYLGSARSYCVYDNIMDNVPRGSQIAVSWTLCVVGDGNGNYRAQVNIGLATSSQLAARLHVELSHYPSQTLANTAEYVTPYAPITIATSWVPWNFPGIYCATFWNHDELGYYVIGEPACGGF
jgi:hypothetical protein